MIRQSRSQCQVLTASRLNDGAVVYADRRGGWSEIFAEAEIFPSPQTAAARLRQAEADQRACRIVEPYLIDVQETEDGFRPLGMRELIRARRMECIATMNSTPGS